MSAAPLSLAVMVVAIEAVTDETAQVVHRILTVEPHVDALLAEDDASGYGTCPSAREARRAKIVLPAAGSGTFTTGSWVTLELRGMTPEEETALLGAQEQRRARLDRLRAERAARQARQDELEQVSLASLTRDD